MPGLWYVPTGSTAIHTVFVCTRVGKHAVCVCVCVFVFVCVCVCVCVCLTLGLVGLAGVR